MEKEKLLAQDRAEQRQKQLKKEYHLKEVEEQYNSLKNMHGGLNGTENTGYDDSAMSMYLGDDDAGMVQINDEKEDKEDFSALLAQHRNHLLAEKVNSGWFPFPIHWSE